MNVKEIVEKYLEENGYDGLYNPDGGCGCEIGDIAPCDGLLSECEPGYKTPCDPETCPYDGDCEFHIGEREEEK